MVINARTRQGDKEAVKHLYKEPAFTDKEKIHFQKMFGEKALKNFKKKMQQQLQDQMIQKKDQIK